MAKISQTALAVTVLLLIMSLPPPHQSLEEKESPLFVTQASDMIADFSLNVASSTKVVDIDHVGQTYVVAVSHDGSGSVGAFAWTGQPAGGALLTLAHNGTVVDTAFTTIAPFEMRASSTIIVTLTNHTQNGVVLQAYDEQLSLINAKTLQSSTTGGGVGDLITYAMDVAGGDIYATFGCPNGQLIFMSQTCSTGTDRYSLITVSWNATTNALSTTAVAKWFSPESTWMNYLPAETGGGFTTIGPNPACPQSLYAHSQGIESMANAHCERRQQTTAQHASSLLGSTSSWSATGGDAMTLSMGLAFSSYSLATSTESFDGDVLAFVDCNSGIDIEVETAHYGSHSALFIQGWTGGGNQECSLIEHEAADAGDTSREVTTFKGRNANMGLLGTSDFSGGIAVKSSRDLLSMAATSTPNTGYAAVCHTGSLTNDNAAIKVGGQNEQISVIAWQGATIINVTSHNVNSGCPEALTAGMGELLMLQNDGILQTLTFFGLDADGDGYGASTDSFPNDADQWSDQDGDGYGDNGGFSNSDDCPFSPGPSTLGRQGCTDIDLDGWADDSDGFPHDSTQWADEDGDGYGDNETGNLGDDCPTIAGASSRDKRGCLDSDFDGFSDENDIFPNDPSQWSDTDGDGFGDNPLGVLGDNCPTIAGTSNSGALGCADQDSDGWADQEDDLPTNPTQWEDLDGDGYGDNIVGLDYDQFKFDPTQQVDSDGDGYGDNIGGTRGDACPNVAGTSTYDRYGCLDTDGDGYSDLNDGFPNNPDQWVDSDGDSYEDSVDDFPFDPSQWLDTDDDGFGDNQFGSNADRFPLDMTQWYDIDGDGYGDNPGGEDYDAFLAEPSQWSDLDNDGCGDNANGRNPDLFPDDSTQCKDEDGDGFGDNQSGNNPDPYLFDFDNDGYNDSIDVLPKLSSPGDLDNDGVPDDDDDFPSNPTETRDFDGDGVGDRADPDDDNDGVLDDAELNAGTDPYNANSKPIDSFEILLPGTNVGLGAWDLIGVFVGIPLTTWILIGIFTRGGRAKRFEERLQGATRREELEEIATDYERAVMMRMLGPHQAIRLERMRTELDDSLEQAMHQGYSGQTSKSNEEQWAEYYRQQEAYEAQQSGTAQGQIVQPHSKDIPPVPSDANYEQEQGW